jgi:hypothetical protein
MLMPGYQKDVLGWTMHPLREAYNKQSDLLTTLEEQATGQDWAGAPIVRPKATLIQAATDRLAHVLSKLGPISIKQFVKGQKEGSNIPGVLTALGFRPPGAEIQAPEQLRAAQEKRQKAEWAAKVKRENRDARQRGLPIPYPGFVRGGPVPPALTRGGPALQKIAQRWQQIHPQLTSRLQP